MKTSYFANRQVVREPGAVSIARWPPRWWGSRRRYTVLAPPADLMKRAKTGMPWPEFIREYRRDVLDHLDPAAVLAELGPDSILLCWETPGKNCHRRLVAEWIEQAMNVRIPEW